MGDLHQPRVSQVHDQNNPIVVDKSEDDMLDLAPALIPIPVQHQLVPIGSLTESIGDSAEEEGTWVSSEEEVEVWEIPHEEFEENTWESSPKL